MVVGIVGLLISLLMWERLGWQRYPAHGPAAYGEHDVVVPAQAPPTTGGAA